jgi:RimJ/RimL family protein N-acetyltransferase
MNRLHFQELDTTSVSTEVVSFLTSNDWPFHARHHLTAQAAQALELGPPESVRTFWMWAASERVGLLRLQDLEDVEDGSVGFDLRVATGSRGQGFGGEAVRWLTSFLFTEYSALNRIEASTRIDNLAMRRALESNRYTHEGTLRETWPDSSGLRHNTALYGRLRSDA